MVDSTHQSVFEVDFFLGLPSPHPHPFHLFCFSLLLLLLLTPLPPRPPPQQLTASTAELSSCRSATGKVARQRSTSSSSSYLCSSSSSATGLDSKAAPTKADSSSFPRGKTVGGVMQQGRVMHHQRVGESVNYRNGQSWTQFCTDLSKFIYSTGAHYVLCRPGFKWK